MTVRHGPLRFTCYGSVSKTFGVSFQEVTYIYTDIVYEINVFKLRWVFFVCVLTRPLTENETEKSRDSVLGKMIRYCRRWWPVWKDECESFKQQHAKALSELERQHNILLDDYLFKCHFAIFQQHTQTVSLVIRYWRLNIPSQVRK